MAWKVVQDLIVPRCTGKTLRVNKGQVFRVIEYEGKQVASKSTRRESIQNIMFSLSYKERQQLFNLFYKLRDEALKEASFIRRPSFP